MEVTLLLEHLQEQSKNDFLSKYDQQAYKNLFQAFIDYMTDPYYVQIMFNANVFYPIKYNPISEVLVDDMSKCPEVFTLEDARFWFDQIGQYAEDLSYSNVLDEITHALEPEEYSIKIYHDILQYFEEV